MHKKLLQDDDVLYDYFVLITAFLSQFNGQRD